MQPSPTSLSVIVRTGGRAPLFLSRALDSVTAQTRVPARIIVVDDGADAAGVEAVLGRMDLRGVALRHLPRDIRIQTQPNRSAALNRGIAETDTRWIAFLDDDDTWAPCFLEQMWAAAAAKFSSYEIGALCCRTEAHYEDEIEGRLVELGQEPFNPNLVEITLARLVEQNLFTNNAVLWQREIFAQIGGYREDLQVLEDWEFNVRACRRFPLAVLPLTLARYHQRPRMHDCLEANSSKQQHDAVRAQLAREWRASGLLSPDRGWPWLRNRWREVRHRWARWRFVKRWGRPS